ncbi:putative helicase mov-10-B.1 isoform X2 [Phymastichus coffea]|nr:putative helicase mov-10-B.1 isoform X2 [Phymastichus coffea]XP_058807109.1 putative helicase mov-10-B.1 isoform X2 [Phymastichus coffea]XP_058807110.1 putative helicase mov-10-B.1 isoform X2 [Phymastichus coffea]XP_058807111.1 putative helicase mov-10-B.1 isoform X2 [Phymastichus coffea]
MNNDSRLYLQVLSALKNATSINISESHYLTLLKLALYLEEHQCNVDMKKYERSGIKIKRPDSQPTMFQIIIEEIDEEKPWIKQNDLVDVIDNASNLLYTLKVMNIQQNNIIAYDENAILDETYTADKLYNVKFRFQNYSLRCCHFALSRILQQNVTTYLFPYKWKSFIIKNPSIYNDFTAVNPSISKNSEQKQAIINIINRSSFPAPYILYGPPGTGKTATLIEAMCQIYSSFPERRVLVCTPSNTAADEIARRLIKYIPPEDIYRFYSQSKDASTIDEQLRPCSNFEGGQIAFVKHEVLEKKSIIISTLCNCMRLIIMRLSPNYFSYVIIDEAGQCIEPDLLIPVSIVSNGGQLCSQIVVAGDPQQLGPTVISKLAAIVLGRTILERLMSYDIYQKDHNMRYNPRYITKLLINYRSPPSILYLSNHLFYDNELYSQFHSNCEKTIFPIIFHGVRGKEEKYFYSPSSCNHTEVQLVLDYVDKLIKNKTGLDLGLIDPDDIGIVTPFTLQSKLIKKKLNHKKLEGINVGTVELFQGQERKVMIMTTVRSKTFFHDGQRHIGFLSSPKRFNVAITRAKTLLIVIGNPTVLQIDYKWNYLLKYCMENKSYHGVKFSLRPVDNKQNNKKLHILESSTLFRSDSGTDLLQSLCGIFFPEIPVIYKKASTNCRISQENYSYQYNQKKSSSCTIL